MSTTYNKLLVKNISNSKSYPQFYNKIKNTYYKNIFLFYIIFVRKTIYKKMLKYIDFFNISWYINHSNFLF